MVIILGYVLIKTVRREIRRRHEIDSLTHSLEKANLKLKELDHQKTEFLSIASHQLRTPLSITKGYAELVADGTFGKPSKKLKDTLNKINESNDRLVKLVDEFLDITKIEQGQTKFNFVKTDINKIISSVVDQLKPKAKEEKLKIVWQKNLKVKKIILDEEKIDQVIFNFVDNALKYSNKGEIKILLEQDKTGQSVRVLDTGLGFGPEDQANFFQKFYRGKNVEGENVTGTGLGLYVCRKFIERHGGQVWAKSKGLGQGSEFGFFIPFGKKEQKNNN